MDAVTELQLSETSPNINHKEDDLVYILPSYCKLSEELEDQLREHFPDVLKVIVSLKRLIQKQQAKISKLKTKLKAKTSKDASTQTSQDDGENPNSNASKSLVDDIKEAAEIAMHNTGFVYEKTSGLYYDYNSGYYYNSELGLYYDGNTGTYMTYNSDSQSYNFHSQVEIASNDTTEESDLVNLTMRSKRKLKGEESLKGCKREKNPASSCQTPSDPEEGECSDSSPEDQESENESSQISETNHTDIAKGWPPCMRIIVKSTSVPKLKEGTLFILTYEGGLLGREGNHSIVIPDINISKHHLKISFNQDAGVYCLTDLGSRNGTLLNGKRISPSKQESESMVVPHGSQIQIGSTVLLCHIHSGNETCGHCEPGLIQNTDEIKENKQTLDKTKSYKRELNKLRKKFGINPSYEGNSTCLGAGYIDRAQARRETVGSHHENEKTQVASVDESISSENKGFKLLSKMGWSEGQSLGKEGTGVLNPVELKTTVGTTGIGYTNKLLSTDKTSQAKPNKWEQAQKRYQELVSSVVKQAVDSPNVESSENSQ